MAIDRTNATQARFTVVMLVVAVVLMITIAVQPVGGHGNLGLQIIFTLGTFLTAVGLAVAVWKRRVLVWAISLILTIVGFTGLLALTLVPRPQLDPYLFNSGAWTHGAISLAAGWSRLGMALLIIAAAIALPFTQSQRQLQSVLALTVIRACIWFGAFWQVSYWILGGRFDLLFVGWAGGVQFLLFVVVALATALLLRGDRRWLWTLTAADQSIAMARYVLPMTLVPVLGSYFSRTGVQIGAFGADVGRLINIEIGSFALLIFGTTILRSLWGERRERDRLASALEQSPVIVYSGAGIIEYWPNACEKLYGFSSSEAIGRRTDELLKTRFPIPFEEFDSILRSKGVWAGELQQTRRDGTRLWVASSIVVIQQPDETSYRLVETLTDITDLKTTSEALNTTTENLSQAVAAYGLGIIEFDIKSNDTTFSPEFEAIVGAEPGTLGVDRRTWRALVDQEEGERLGALLIDDVSRHAASRSIDTRIRRADGELRDVYGTLRYDYSQSGNLRRVVGMFMDVTERLRERAEYAAGNARLMELQAELTHTSRLSAMGEMAAALAHELNQPLTAVGNSVGAIDLILKDPAKPFDEKTRERVLRAAKHAESQAVRAGEIVRRLRGFISRGDADTRSEDLRTLIDDAVALALPNPRAAQVSLRISVAPDAAIVLADRIQVQQVFVNLVRNAVESMRHQSSPRVLTVSVVREDTMALIQVKDTGPGVPRDMLEALFSAFQSTKKDGMGVGLSICRRIIESHGGKMWLEPSDEGGADFRFTLPIFPDKGED